MRGVFLVIVALLAVPRPAAAQAASSSRPDQSRLMVDVNLVGTSTTLAESRTFTYYFVSTGEVGTFRAVYPDPARANMLPILDVGAVWLLSPRVGFGLQVNRSVYEETAQLTAIVPHPLFYNSMATATTGTDGPMRRSELSLNPIVAMLPIRTPRVHMRMYAGPSIVLMTNEMVSDIQYSQQSSTTVPAQNAINITGVTTETVHSRGFGFTMGADLTIYLNRVIGLTGGVRFSRTTITMDEEPLSQLAQKFRGGGGLITFGVRFRLGR